jgi:succinate dehydrogenase hydrophobic anchor subunit
MFKTRMHLLFLFSGVGIAVFLGIHMAVQHLNRVLAAGEPDPVSWLSMLGRATQNGWVVVYIFLLAFGLYHALYGLRGIILELTTSEKTERVITWFFIAAGLAVFGWASYVPVALLVGR